MNFIYGDVDVMSGWDINGVAEDSVTLRGVVPSGHCANGGCSPDTPPFGAT